MTEFAKTVSILIPVYNREKYIAGCIQSALDQTHSHIEVVVSDNQSTDETWKICKQFAARDSRVRIFQNEINAGPVRNWLRCAQEARGMFSKMLFSDDLLERNCIEMMLLRMTPETAFVLTSARIGESRQTAQITWKEYLNRQLDGRLPDSPCAALMRTSDFLENLKLTFPTCVPRPFERHGAGPDAMSMILTAKNYPYVACIQEPLVFFLAHSGSITVSARKKRNVSNPVIDGYTSAKSYFLKKNESWSCWLKYVFRRWLTDMNLRHSWISFSRYLKDREGDGTMSEYIVVVLLAPIWISPVIFRKILRTLF
jgi:glycosyltransferase involved in cell wall biosynthesis